MQIFFPVSGPPSYLKMIKLIYCYFVFGKPKWKECLKSIVQQFTALWGVRTGHKTRHLCSPSLDGEANECKFCNCILNTDCVL